MIKGLVSGATAGENINELTKEFAVIEMLLL